jgi:hypothetical protein
MALEKLIKIGIVIISIYIAKAYSVVGPFCLAATRIGRGICEKLLSCSGLILNLNKTIEFVIGKP